MSIEIDFVRQAKFSSDCDLLLADVGSVLAALIVWTPKMHLSTILFMSVWIVVMPLGRRHATALDLKEGMEFLREERAKCIILVTSSGHLQLSGTLRQCN